MMTTWTKLLTVAFLVAFCAARKLKHYHYGPYLYDNWSNYRNSDEIREKIDSQEMPLSKINEYNTMAHSTLRSFGTDCLKHVTVTGNEDDDLQSMYKMVHKERTIKTPPNTRIHPRNIKLQCDCFKESSFKGDTIKLNCTCKKKNKLVPKSALQRYKYLKVNPKRKKSKNFTPNKVFGRLFD